ncbi:MAG: hypothetical protein HPY66_3504 [Firmicutes bacterium]|nr:hypothetical protein [Bacillota bacterium]MDI6706029.1 DUF3866 family protein [Bacillota bacterium]
MIRTRVGTVKRIIAEAHGTQLLEVEVDGKDDKAISYLGLTGKVQIGNRLLLNTTASYLGLGTGGYHFVMANYDSPAADLHGKGHIMKLRYTPLQGKCLAVEEQQSEWHERIKAFGGLRGTPVLTVGLHSMLPPLCAAIKILKPDKRIGYVMTDGAALPMAFSDAVAELKEKSLIETAVSAGNAFGGDLEAVNFFTGIIAAREAAGCDIIIVGMGPGIVGTGTKYGFSGIEQGYIIDGINTLGGLPITVPRVSFADMRNRHRGISHHTITVLTEIAKTRSVLPLPVIEDEKLRCLKEQVTLHGIDKKHRVLFREGDLVFDAVEEYGLQVTTMGRGIKDDPDYFKAVGSAAVYCCEYAQ